jgi:hypothetical protein
VTFDEVVDRIGDKSANNAQGTGAFKAGKETGGRQETDGQTHGTQSDDDT